MNHIAEFYCACSKCGWEEDVTHDLLSECRTQSCPKCGCLTLHKEVQISKVLDDGTRIAIHRTYHRYGRIKLEELNSLSVDKNNAKR